MKARTLVEDHRWLLKYFASKNPVEGLKFTIPYLAMFFYFGSVADRTILMNIAIIGLGALYWSFIEYAAHRWFYHWTPRNKHLKYVIESFHIYHHRHIEDMEVLNAGIGLASMFALVMGLPVFILSQDLAFTSLVMFGAASAYYIYEWVHYALHQKPYDEETLLGRLQRFHYFHHEKNWNVNFGVTNPYWDILFRTHMSTEKAKLKLVTRESLA